MKEKALQKVLQNNLEEIKAFNKKLENVVPIQNYKNFWGLLEITKNYTKNIMRKNQIIQIALITHFLFLSVYTEGKRLIEEVILQSLDEALKNRQDFEQLLDICFEVDSKYRSDYANNGKAHPKTWRKI